MNERPGGGERDELLALYALGVLAPAEAAVAAALVARDPAAGAAFERLRSAADAIALGAEEPLPAHVSDRMRTRLRAAIRPSSAVPLRPARTAALGLNWGFGLAAAAALAFAFASLFQNVALRTELAAQQARTDRIVADVTAPDARRYAVADGAIVVRGSRLYLALAHLPQPPAGAVYQAWTAPRGASGVRPSITFVPDADGSAIVALPVDAAAVAGVGITVEPVGGSATPTTKPLFLRPLG